MSKKVSKYQRAVEAFCREFGLYSRILKFSWSTDYSLYIYNEGIVQRKVQSKTKYGAYRKMFRRIRKKCRQALKELK